MTGMTKGEAIAHASGQLGSDGVAVSALGYASWWLFTAGDRDLNLYLKGSMGLATSVGFGLALAHPGRDVVVFEGDGSLLMNLGGLTTIGAYGPSNLTIIALDDRAYETTGRQSTHTGRGADLLGLAAASGIEASSRAETPEQLAEYMRMNGAGPRFVVVPVTQGSGTPKRYPGSPHQNLLRLRWALSG
ncbi:MAG: thiamine pyrophosphate-dependent enzyme [Nostocoides sp.]